MSHRTSIRNRDNSLVVASGEQLLLMAVLQGTLRPRIDRELDRRSIRQRVNRHIGRHSAQMQLAA
jgi:hypothetical protein